MQASMGWCCDYCGKKLLMGFRYENKRYHTECAEKVLPENAQCIFIVW